MLATDRMFQAEEELAKVLAQMKLLLQGTQGLTCPWDFVGIFILTLWFRDRK